MYNFDYPRKQEEGDLDADDVIEDDRLLKSLEKRFNQYD
jgi:hypothetical protein